MDVNRRDFRVGATAAVVAAAGADDIDETTIRALSKTKPIIR
jgi:hypothetical protein